ncbi:MAG: hypothetical protein ABI402_12590 [Ferruginibacter sp.]
MKRDEALAPLSREHHDALILARLLQKNAPAYKNLPIETSEKAAYALEMYNNNLQDHFLKEEKMLDKLKNIHAEIDRLSAEIITEHRMLTISFMGLNKKEDLVEAMDTLGFTLEKHIRKEERILFPLIQQHCSQEILKTIVL